MKEGGFDASAAYDDLRAFVATRDTCHLFKGWFSDTIPAFLADRPHATCSLIHVDCDLYESTRDALTPMIGRLALGGAILFDEIFHEEYPGETAAFRDVYNTVSETVGLEFHRVQAMP